MFKNREASGRIGKWAAQLAKHAINFTSCSAIKSQVLADFIADWTPSCPEQEQPTTEVIWQMVFLMGPIVRKVPVLRLY